MINFLKSFLNLNVYLTLLLAVTAVIGDIIVNHANLHLFRAVFDNCTHGAIGALSWLLVALNTRYSSRGSLWEVGVCLLLSCLIDIDHFIEAKSFQLKKATKLLHRPFLHCSTFPLLIVFLLLCTSYVLKIPWLKKFALIVLTAFASHHIRDATRRGFWFCPFGSTPSLPYGIYMVLTCLVPYFVLLMNKLVKISNDSFETESSEYLI